jgi:hypothetical protein
VLGSEFRKVKHTKNKKIRRKKMDKQRKILRVLTMMIIATLLAATAFVMISCGQGEIENPDITDVGGDNLQGKTTFTFEVVYIDGTSLSYDIETTKATVGEALLEKNLIEGEQGPYGLYVKTVCGATYDYDIDKAYWAFYINDETAASGVDSTYIENGAKYSFKVEK